MHPSAQRPDRRRAAVLHPVPIPAVPGQQLERLAAAAVTHGLTLLDQVWQGWEAQYALECRHGHRLCRSAAQVVYRAVRCADCHRASRLTALQAAAAARGGACLEQTYLGEAPHRFRCAEGHEWQARPSRIVAGGWCRHCAAKLHGRKIALPDGLQRLQQAAKAKGGTCLATQYLGLAQRYRFRCMHGHEWETAGHEVMRGAWCRVCANLEKAIAYRAQDGLARLQQAATAHGGLCLDADYLGCNQRYRFRCRSGHEWQTTGHKVLLGSWCPQCAHDRKKLSLDDVRADAQARGGQCLASEYINSTIKLEWECHRGHRWWAAASTIRAGHWCRQCAILDRIHNPTSRARFKYEADRPLAGGAKAGRQPR
ncbi:hypothetical protein N8I74_18955 [Chitiniphilus purpureus]|uniref:Zinc-ribbon domain-containing protein n=1 Tax=Chitiniphilus purpureus TaxID=2981137 RepID=A0ABY6DMX6_9NEIS|nr:hypothetical protein [Chitiniphilus sp. CD1]UXY15362.1 hypothetical protein N8I74_18955 [Chitiniphilus sp. CD1]